MIPEGWSVATLKEIGTFSKGSGIKKDDVLEVGIPCIRYGQIYTEYEHVIKHVRTFVSGTVAKSSRQLSAGEILFAGSGETKEEIGKCVAYIEDVGAVAGGDIVILTPKGADSCFLGFALNAHDVVVQKTERAQGDAVVHISASNLATIQVLLPPLHEQLAIAEALSDADALVESLDALIAKKLDIKQAVMQELLTGRTRLRGESAEWVVAEVGEFARILKGRGLSRDAVLGTGRHPCLLYGELFTTYKQVARGVGGRTNSLDGELSVSGDVLIPGSTTTSGEDLATATALLMDGVRIGGDVNIVRPDPRKVDPRWLAYVFTYCHRHDVVLRAQGVTIHHLYGRDIASIEMRLPDRDEQTRLADVLEDIDAEIDALIAQREKAELVKQGMMQELLSGRVRLV